jgi:hypothetical protein
MKLTEKSKRRRLWNSQFVENQISKFWKSSKLIDHTLKMKMLMIETLNQRTG